MSFQWLLWMGCLVASGSRRCRGRGLTRRGRGLSVHAWGRGWSPHTRGWGSHPWRWWPTYNIFPKYQFCFQTYSLVSKSVTMTKEELSSTFQYFFHVPYMGGGGPLIPWGGLQPGGGLIPGGGGGIPIPGTPGGGGICEPVKYIIIIIIYIYTFFNYQVMKSNKRLVLLSSITKRENLKFSFAF